MAEAEGNQPVEVAHEEQMATEQANLQVDCTICCEVLDDPRVLHCGHGFCISCIDHMNEEQMINCPICRKDTTLLYGQQAKDLPKKVPFARRDSTKDQPKIVKGVQFPYAIRDILFDDENQWLIVTTRDSEKPVQVFTYQGTRCGIMGKGVLSSARNVAIDTKRNWICVTTETHVATFDAQGEYGSKMKILSSGVPSGITYNADKDLYIITDIKKHCITFFDPRSGQVLKTVGKKGQGDAELDCPGFICTDTKTLAVSDNRNHVIKVFDKEGQFLKKFGYHGKGYGQFEYPQGICMDTKGRILVCDDYNQRVVRVGLDLKKESEEWQTVIPSGALGGDGHFPYAMDVNKDGLMAVSTYTTLRENPVDTLYILRGYDNE